MKCQNNNKYLREFVTTYFDHHDSVVGKLQIKAETVELAFTGKTKKKERERERD